MPNSAKTLVVRHQTGTQFVIARLEDGKATGTVSLSPPDTIQVEGRSNSQLLNDLRWYLERFLDYPFEPNTELAERIQDSVKQWGRSAFQQLFTGQALLWYDGIRITGLTNLVLKIASDDPRVLAWPWETLSDPHGTTLAHQCRLERQLGELHDPLPLPEGLSQTQVNLLLVIARPYGVDDVDKSASSCDNARPRCSTESLDKLGRDSAMIETHGLSHVALEVQDPDRSLAFYQSVFGVREYFRNDSTIQVLGPGKFDVLAFEKRSAGAGVPGGIIQSPTNRFARSAGCNSSRPRTESTMWISERRI